MSDNSSSSWAIAAAVGFILVIAAVALFLHLSTTDIEFSRYNPEWNGTSQVFEALDNSGTVMVRDPAALRGRHNATLLVIAPARAPTAEEGSAYRSFVAAGNTLILADDFGSGNELLQAIGASTRLDRGNLSSLEREFESSEAPLGFPVKGQPLVADLSKVVFNRPVAVFGGNPLINTTYLSWIDTDGDGRVDRTEPLGRFTVATEETVGAGKVVVIGDASLFINAMQGLSGCDNGLLVRRLAADATLTDQRLSQTATAAGPISTFLWVRETPALVVVVTALSLGLIAWSFGRRRR
ncbi:MAG: DUF4350 domain-containing protein [Methanospirillum sp.]